MKIILGLLCLQVLDERHDDHVESLKGERLLLSSLRKKNTDVFVEVFSHEVLKETIHIRLSLLSLSFGFWRSETRNFGLELLEFFLVVGEVFVS